MRHRLTHYALLLLGIVFVISPVACVGRSEPMRPEPIVQWYKTFGDGENEYGYSVQQTTDDGYIMYGMTESYGAGGRDAWLIKTDADGNKLWDKTFGGGMDDHCYSVQQTIEGGYIGCGTTESYGDGGRDAWLIKTDAEGGKLWDKTFGGGMNDYCYSVQQTIEGGYIVCGTTESYGAGGQDAWLIKTDADGSKLWDKTFGGKKDDVCYSVQQAADGGYILCGNSGNTQFIGAGCQDAWLIKTDADGNKLWDKTFGGKIGYSVRETTDSGYVICGVTTSAETHEPAVWLIRTDAEGNKIWDKTFAPRTKWLGIWNCASAQATDGGYIICGTGEPNGMLNRVPAWLFLIISAARGAKLNIAKISVLLIKTDADGNKLWDMTFSDYRFVCGNSIQQTTDGGYIMCGMVSSYEAGTYDVLLLKMAPEQ